MKIKLLLSSILILASGIAKAQSTYFMRNMDDQYLIDRVDVLSGRLSDTVHTSIQPFNRKESVNLIENYMKQRPNLSKRESYELRKIISKNGEWAKKGDGFEKSKYPILKHIYRTKSDFYSTKVNNVFFAVNPIINYQQMVGQGQSDQFLFLNSKGIEARAVIADRIGLYSTFTDNQERGPWHHQQYVLKHDAVPGASYFKTFKELKPGYAQDYIYAAAYFDAEVIKNTFNVSFGHNRFHLGDGYRSLFLSDNGSNYLFMKLNTRFGRVNYQNLFMELTPSYARGGDRLLPRKYAAMHHLSINATRWLNIGLFEGVIFGRTTGYDFQYMNPIILYRSIEQNAGSPDNAVLGMNFKINTRIKTVLYGQVLLDEFKFSEIKAGEGWWANKWGLQLGFKNADLFNIKNLMIQGELNAVRPFTYSRDSATNYIHYNQPLAHPFGANFIEANLIVNYKPMDRLQLTWRSFYNKQGRDSSRSVSFGSDIAKHYKTKNANYGINFFNGFPTEVLYTNLNASYELRDNFFLDLGLLYRYQNSTNKYTPAFQGAQIYAGFRLNAVRRLYDY